MIAFDLDRRDVEEGCLSDLGLDQLLTREIEGTLVEQARRAHLTLCPSCAERLRMLETDATILLARRPTLGLPSTHRRGRWSSGRGLVGVAGTAVAAAALLFLALRPSSVPPSTYRLKGGVVEIELFTKRRDSGGAALLAGDAVRPGDAVRFRVTSRRAGYVGVVSIDGRGTVTSYGPVDRRLLPPMGAAESRLLDGSVVLDGVLGREQVLAFLCAEQLETSRLVDAVRAAVDAGRVDPMGSPNVGLDCAQSSFWFTKVASP